MSVIPPGRKEYDLCNELTINIPRKIKWTYGILQVETQEGGCEQKIINSGMITLENAILTLEKHLVNPDPNCDYYITVYWENIK